MACWKEQVDLMPRLTAKTLSFIVSSNTLDWSEEDLYLIKFSFFKQE